MTRTVTAYESIRLKALHNLRILDTPRNLDFDGLVELAEELFEVPISLVSLIDEKRQWFKASVGLEVKETAREVAFCNHTIRSATPFVVRDAQLDDRFMENPLVTGEPKIRFYAGVPLAIEAGINIGTLCIIDTKPRDLDQRQVRQLQRLGAIGQSLLRQHKIARDNADLAANTATQMDLISKQSAALEKQRQLLECASDLAKMGAWEEDLTNDRVEWSGGLFKLHEMEPTSELKIADQMRLYPQRERDRLEKIVAESERDQSGFSFEGQMFTAKGNPRWVRVVGNVEVKDGRVVRRFGVKQDITEQKVLTERISKHARCDDLTGLANRRAFREKLVELSSATANRPAVSLFLFDLDAFNEINDSYGHAAGDACLRRIAQRVRSCAVDDCMVARIGGDEFAVLNFNGAKFSLNDFAARIRAAVARPIRWQRQTFQVSSSLGFTSRGIAENFAPDKMTHEADLALYQAKRAGRNCYRAYTPELDKAAMQRHQTLAEVRQALASDRMELYFQPKVNLISRRVVGYEALLRLNLADGRVLAPDAFAPALQDFELSNKIGEFVVSAAIRQARQWQEENIPFGGIAINLSASQFSAPDFAHKLLSAIREANLRSEAIEVELTEGIVLSAASENVLAACKVMHDAGMHIAFDDFGTGFASLTHLRDFPVDILKIDRSFVKDLTSGGNTTAIVNAMVALGRNLSMSVVAEGVETEDQAGFLTAIGCDVGQGYLFGRPMKAGDVPRFDKLRSRMVQRL